MAEFDYSSLSDEELERIASQAVDYSQYSDEELERIAGGSEPAEGTSALRTGILAAADSAPFAKQIGAGMRAAVRFVQDPYGGTDPVEAYRKERDAISAGLEQAEAENPLASGVGTAAGIGAQLVSGGVNPVSLVKGAYQGGRALLTAEGAGAAVQAGRALLTREGARVAAVEGGKAAAAGAGYGAAYGLSESDADLTRGEFAEAATDTLEGAATGALVGVGARGLLGAGSAALEGRTAAAGQEVAGAVAAERETALIKTGLEGKQKTLGGAKRAKERAQALYDEPSPQDPRKTLLQQVEGVTPDERLEYATRLRQETGQQLGAIRDELAKTKAAVPVSTLRDQFKGAFAELPTEVQAKAIEQLDGMVAAAAKDGAVPADTLRKVIQDVEGLAKFGTPNLEAALGNARARVFQAARGVLVQNERELIATNLKDRVPEYTEALRKYGVYSDFELGSKIMLERANKGLPAVKVPKVPETERGVGRQLLGLVVGKERVRTAETILERWQRWQAPTVAKTSAQLKKLERLQPMMDEAARKGPAEVARIHAIFMQRSPDYRKAIESGE